MNKFKWNSLLTLFVILCNPGVASANAGVPMIFAVMPALGLSIIPIILIEALFLRKRLNIKTSSAVKTTSVSNLVSTVVGVPLTWLLLVLIQMLAGGGGAFGLDTLQGKILSVTLQSAWLIPYESDLYWMIPAAGLFLLIPFFFVSWWFEYLVSKKMLENLAPKSVKVEVRNANIITYALLAFWPIGLLVFNVATKQ